MLLLGAEASFKTGGPFLGEFTSEHLPQGLILCRPSLAYEGSGYPIFRAELSVGIIGIYGIGSHASYPHMHESLLHANTESFRRIPSLKALNEMCSMNDMPSICILFTFAPNSTDLVSLLLTMGRT